MEGPLGPLSFLEKKKIHIYLFLRFLRTQTFRKCSFYSLIGTKWCISKNIKEIKFRIKKTKKFFLF